jgi:hypothetical protein
MSSNVLISPTHSPTKCMACTAVNCKSIQITICFNLNDSSFPFLIGSIVIFSLLVFNVYRMPQIQTTDILSPKVEISLKTMIQI